MSELRDQPHIAQAVVIWTLRESGMSSAAATSLALAVVRDLREAVSDLDGDGVVIDDDGFLARLRCVSRMAGEYVLVTENTPTLDVQVTADVEPFRRAIIEAFGE